VLNTNAYMGSNATSTDGYMGHRWLKVNQHWLISCFNITNLAHNFSEFNTLSSTISGTYQLKILYNYWILYQSCGVGRNFWWSRSR
jgi:hypothetical protein